MAVPVCSKCAAPVQFVQRVYEFHNIENIDENNNVDLSFLEDAICDEEYAPRLQCSNCHAEFELDMTPIP
jgi:protein-arginine kinase activator protein McsA